MFDAKKEGLDFKVRLKNYSKSDIKVVSLLIALNRDTKILVLDDLKIGIENEKLRQIDSIIKETKKRKKLSIIFLTSDKESVESLSDRQIYL